MLNLMHDACLWVCCTVDPPSETVLVNDVIRLSVCLSVSFRHIGPQLKSVGISNLAAEIYSSTHPHFRHSQ